MTGGLARYRHVLGQPNVAALLVSSILARMPTGMTGLAVLLLLAARDGYARAGLGTGLAVVGAVVSSVWLARRADRHGARAVLLPSAVAFAVFATALIFAVHGPYWGQLAVCVGIGVTTSPVSAVSRSLWPQVLTGDDVQSVFSLDATVQEVVFIAGPSLVAVVGSWLGRASALGLAAGVGIAGSALFAVAEQRARRDVRAAVENAPSAPGDVVTEASGRWWLRLAPLLVVGLGLTMAFSCVEVATVAFTHDRQSGVASGIVLAIWSTGSMVGGVLFGAATAPAGNRDVAVPLLGVAGGCAVGALAPDPVGLGVLLFVGGLAIAPTMSRLYARVSAAAGSRSTVEAFGWLTASFTVGSSLGSALGGVSAELVGGRWTFLVGAALAAVGVPGLLGAFPLRVGRVGSPVARR